MNSNSKRNMWQALWGYSESFVIVVGIIAIGLMLQKVVGSFDFYLLARPVNYIVGCMLLLLSIVVGLAARRSLFARWFIGVPFSVALIVGILSLAIIMGLIPQTAHPSTSLGFETMTSAWPFVLLYALLLLSLGAVIVARARNFAMGDLSFYLNHVGLYLLLLASGLGYADMQRYIMYVSEGETQWRVYDSELNIEELPIAISLHDFSVDYYPSKPIYFDAQSGEIQKGNPSQYEGDERYKKVMSEPEPKRFSSQVEVFTQQGHSVATTIEVNKPLRIDSWTIYQYGYDNAAGNLSSYSSFELVYDSSIPLVYTGIILMMLGGVVMILTGHKPKHKNVKL